MRKYSRRNGWMRLETCAPGDGAVSFSWVESRANPGPPERQVQEPVTESDVSEFLRDPLNADRWAGWEIVMLGDRPRLARMAVRPHHTSRKLVMDGVEYEYSAPERRDLGAQLTSFNAEFRVGGEVVKDMEAVLSLVFFLNHEADFRASGLETRARE